MIKLNLENAVKASAIDKYAKDVKKIARAMDNLESTGFDFLGWKDWPAQNHKKLQREINAEAKRLKREKVDVLVVIGIGGSFAGAKAAIEMVRGFNPAKQDMEIIFAGESMSSTDLAQKLSYVQNRNFAINVISKSGGTLEPSVAFRLFKRLLEERVGVNNAKRFIVATTDANNGVLLKMALTNEWSKFVIPDNIGGRFSVLTAVGLFPMACNGLNIGSILKGAATAQKKFALDSLIQNDAYRYAVSRIILNKTNGVELMVQYEPQMKGFSEWWKQLAGESEGKGGKGLFPASAVFSTDLHSLGQYIQSGTKQLFETVMTVKVPNIDLEVFSRVRDDDNLNRYSGLSVHNINTTIFKATTDAHVNAGKVPNIHIELEKMNEEGFGQLAVFFQRAVAMTAYLLDVNPFNQPGVEVYKLNIKNMLGK